MDMLSLKLVLSFIVGGIWISLATLLAERAGSRLGGIVASLPSNMVVSFFFMGWAYGPQFASEAAAVFPLASLSYLAFLFVFLAASKRYGWLSFGFGLAAWLALAIPLGLLGNDDIVLGMAAYAAATALVFYVVEKHLGIRSTKGSVALKRNSSEIAFRAVFAGSMIALIVGAANFFGPVWGGILVTFPAAFSSTIFLLVRSGGFNLARATTKTMLLSSSCCVAYAICASLAYPALGIVAGTVLSYFAAVLTVLLLKPITDRAG